MKIYIDSGHGKDTGAKAELFGTTICERDINQQISSLMTNMLLETNINILSNFAHAKECSLTERIKLINNLKPDLVLSIHCNAHASNAKGFEVWSYPSFKGQLLANRINHSMEKDIDRKNRGIFVSKRLAILRRTICPAVLIECGFMSNKEELKWLLMPENQIKIAQSSCWGIIEYSYK